MRPQSAALARERARNLAFGLLLAGTFVVVASGASATVPVQEQEGDLLDLTEEIRDLLDEILDYTIDIEAHTANIEYYTGLLEKKIVEDDPDATAEMQQALPAIENAVVKWVATERFGKPVFSTSFYVDSYQAAEDASRVFLNELDQLTQGGAFCSGLPPIPPEAFSQKDVATTLTCTATGDLEAFNRGDIFDYDLLAESEASTNEYWNLVMAALDKKTDLEQASQGIFEHEYNAGQGFLALYDEDPNSPTFGQVENPPGTVHDYTSEVLIDLPVKQVSNADDTQTAHKEILDDAIDEVIKQGLGLTSIAFSFTPPTPTPPPGPPRPPPAPPPPPAMTVKLEAQVPGYIPWTNVLITFDAAPYNAVDIRWTTTGSPSSCDASATPALAGWSGSKSSGGGTQSITFPTGIYTLVITCTKGATTVQDLVNVTVLPYPGSGIVYVKATLDGSAWNGRVDYELKDTIDIDCGPSKPCGNLPSTLTSVIADTYTLIYNGGGPAGAFLKAITPNARQTLASSGSITYTLEFETGGTIQVNATLNGSPWPPTPPPQAAAYTLAGPSPQNGTLLPQTFSALSAGSYTLTFASGGPAGATLTGILPSPTQTLSKGGLITFTLDFTD